MNRKRVQILLIVLAVAVLAIQFVGPKRTNPPIDPSRELSAHVKTPPEVAGILERSCLDCHSHQTRWPWYSKVAPVSWFVISDVNEARRHMNFSDWAKYNQQKALDRLNGICEETSEGGMPLSSYLWMHSDAKLTPQDVRTLCEWSRSAREQLAQAK